MSYSLTYQLANLTDLEILVESRVEFLTGHWGNQPEESEAALRSELQSYFESAIPAKRYLCWIVRDGEQWVAVGGMSVEQRPGSFRARQGTIGYVMNIYTKPAYRRRGIATELMRMIEAFAIENGMNFLELTATEAGAPVYEKVGFNRHSEPVYRKFIQHGST